jgi:hypothetical protein
MDDLKAFFQRISGKLALLLGGTLVVGSASASISHPSLPVEPSNDLRPSNSIAFGKLRSKLVLRKANNTLRLIAQHSSHSSHSSHASHASHSSHASHGSHASHASHSSHSSRAI